MDETYIIGLDCIFINNKDYNKYNKHDYIKNF